MNHWVFERKFLKVEKIEKRKKKEVDAKHLPFLCGDVTAKQY